MAKAENTPIDNNSTKFLFILLLGVLAFFISLYLIIDHIEDREGSFCDVNSHISCSKVRRSVFSELFNVPIALSGAIYNLITVAFALRGFIDSRNPLYISGLFYWSIFGATFIFYLLFAELHLSALCPFCTILHFVQFIIVYLSWKIFNTQSKQLSFFQTLFSLKLWLIIITLLNVLPIIYFNVLAPQTTTSAPIYEAVPKDFCDCVTFSGWRFYGRAGCSWCEKQKLLFGDSFKYIVFIDCANAEAACHSLNIDGFPTWIKFTESGEEVGRWRGYSTLENLSSISNCSIPPEFLSP